MEPAHAAAVLPVAPLVVGVAPAVVAAVAAGVTPRAGMGHLALCKVTGRALACLLAPMAVSLVAAAGVAVVCPVAVVAVVVLAGVLLA